MTMNTRKIYLFLGVLLINCNTSVSAQHCPRTAGSPRENILSLGVLFSNKYRKQLEPAIRLALYHVQSSSKILPHYCIDLIFKDTQCKTSLGMKSLFDLMSQNQRPFALFGDVCTNVNEPVAMASKYWNILQLSYAETHAKFSSADSKDQYPTFFRMVPGDRNLIPARCHLLLKYHWKRVGTIKQSDDPKYALPHEKLTTVLENTYNISVIYTAGISVDQVHNIGYELDELKNRDARVLIADFSPALGLKIFCEAYQNEMYGPNYVWILQGNHKNDWLETTDSGTNCTLDQIEEVLNGHFVLEFASQRPDTHKRLVSNKTVIETNEELKLLCDRRRCETDEYSFYAYDGIWSLALALNATIGGNSDAVSPDLASKKFIHSLRQTTFEGVTGKVVFNNNERLGLVYIRQYYNQSYVTLGHYDNSNGKFVIEKLANWEPPIDATIVVHELQYVSYYLLAIMCSLSTIGVVLALFFLFFNIKHRNYRFIRMSSPQMNNLIIAGSMCTYISIFLVGVDTRFVSESMFKKMCYAKTWVLSIGFTLAFGSMFSKTWRVHSIFTNIRKDKKAIKDYQLFIIVAFILTIDVIILCMWAVLSPFKYSITNHEKIQSKNYVIIPQLERCKSEYSIFFQMIFYVIKGMLMIFGCFLAWETRAVNVPALNDSKYIGMSVYNVVVMCVIGLSLSFILQERVNEAYALTSFFIIFCTTLTLSLVFVPKIIELVRTPRGTDHQRYRKGLMKSVVGKNGTDKLQRQLSMVVGRIKEKIHRVEEENLRLHQILATKSAELWDNLERLRLLGESVRDQKGTRNLCCVGPQVTSTVPPMTPMLTGLKDPQNNTPYYSEDRVIVLSARKTLIDKEQLLQRSPTQFDHSIEADSEAQLLIFDDMFSGKSDNTYASSITGLSTMVRHKSEGWPWLDPTEHTTML